MKKGIIDPVTGRGFVNGYEVVDLGLLSGLLWATCNVEATSETKYGNYYQWGAGAVTYDESEKQYHRGGTNLSYILPSSADTATQVMGSEWRMPTLTEFQELIDNTDYEWITNFNGSGKNGGKFTSKTNPNAYVFFPACGVFEKSGFSNGGSVSYVWTSTANNSPYALGATADGSVANFRNGYRYEGQNVRGVTSLGGVS